MLRRFSWISLVDAFLLLCQCWLFVSWCSNITCLWCYLSSQRVLCLVLFIFSVSSFNTRMWTAYIVIWQPGGGDFARGCCEVLCFVLSGVFQCLLMQALVSTAARNTYWWAGHLVLKWMKLQRSKANIRWSTFVIVKISLVLIDFWLAQEESSACLYISSVWKTLWEPLLFA